MIISLSKLKYSYDCFSLNIEQADVINHINGDKIPIKFLKNLLKKKFIFFIEET